MFVGRKQELDSLEQCFRDKRAKIVTVYGRRRIGKSYLIEHFVRGKKCLRFEGLESQKTPTQIKYFVHDLAKQLGDDVLAHAEFDHWENVFEYLTDFMSHTNEKWIIFFDEFQWLAANQGRLVSLLKKYWDQSWSKQKVLIILCGSVSSYMVKNVIKSKAMYGRIDLEICLTQLSPREAFLLAKSKRSAYEIFRYLLLIGAVPKYLTLIDARYSLEQNINKLCFTKNGYFVGEYEKIFYSQFRDYRTYEQIVGFLQDRPRSIKEISEHLKIPSGGGLLGYLNNLEKALFVTCYTSYEKGYESKNKRYKLTDEFLCLYFKFIKPNLKIIKASSNKTLFSLLVKNKWNPWLGFAFENFCLKNAIILAEKMGFADQVINYGPYFKQGDERFQIDLLFIRADKTITLCELKYHDEQISTVVIKEVEKKCALISIPRGYTLEKALISQCGPDEHLARAEYFHHFVSVEDWFS